MAVTSWNGDFAQLTFGIEQEQFILHRGTPPSLERLQSLFQHLQPYGFTPHVQDSTGRIVSLYRESNTGALVIKSDFCTHIFEYSFPPMRRVAEFVEAYRDIASLVGGILPSLNLAIQPGGALENMPENVVIAPSDSDLDQRRVRWFLSREVPDLPFSHSLFFAGMCATQVHFNLLDDAFYPLMPAYYAAEYLAPLLYSNSPGFNGRHAHCARPLMYRDGLAPSYRAGALPDPIPASKAAYDALIANTEHFVRDYSFITPTRHGTVEFRTGCSQHTLEEIVELLALRVAIIAAVTAGRITPRDETPAIFWEVCTHGTVTRNILEADYYALEHVKETLPGDFRSPLERVLIRFARVLR